MKFLGQKEAQDLDAELFSEVQFSVDQLMELAGLSVAVAVRDIAIKSVSSRSTHPGSRVLIVCGPGNNGGDGLVAARHLLLFGMDVKIVYPKQVQKRLFLALVKQCQTYGITVDSTMPTKEELRSDFDFVVDAIFGFSFKGSPRSPFDAILATIIESGVDVISVDIPSGWDVENGPQGKGTTIAPAGLVSLTAPKMCAKFLPRECTHYLGGRFVPPPMANKYNLDLPAYAGTNCVLQL